MISCYIYVIVIVLQEYSPELRRITKKKLEVDAVNAGGVLLIRQQQTQPQQQAPKQTDDYDDERINEQQPAAATRYVCTSFVFYVLK